MPSSNDPSVPMPPERYIQDPLFDLTEPHVGKRSPRGAHVVVSRSSRPSRPRRHRPPSAPLSRRPERTRPSRSTPERTSRPTVRSVRTTTYTTADGRVSVTTIVVVRS